MTLLTRLGTGSKVRAYLVAHGNVYEGGFHLHVENTARAHGLKGWMKVTQLPTTSYIEMEIEGLKTVIDKYLLMVCEGTPSSQINDVQVEWRTYNGRFQDFRRS